MSNWSGRVIEINDRRVNRDDHGWEATVAQLRDATTLAGTPLNVEVCDEPA
jgi:hypothetical protein